MEITAANNTVIPNTIGFSTTAVPNTRDRPLVFNSLETAPIIFKVASPGLVSGATTTSLSDNTAAWTVDQWKDYYVLITLGKGIGQWRKVINNTAQVLNVAEWDTGGIPDATSTYRIFTGVAVQAARAGKAGNVLAGAINRLTTPVAFVSHVVNPVAAINGVDMESDRLFLSRFLLTVRQRSAGGNDTDYQIWARETPGTSLGAVSVIEEWNGYGTVKVVIINSDNTISNAATVSKVYDYIETRRPIGAHVTVEAAVAVLVEARFTLTVQDGFSLAAVQQDVKQAIIDYLNAMPVGGDDGFVLFYRVQQAALEGIKGIDTFNMYSTGYGIRRAGASTFSTADVTVTGTEKPVAGTVTAV
jgi:phage-related baseplate assembly protein